MERVMCALVLLAALLGSGSAAAQACFTCRDRDCPDKKGIPDCPGYTPPAAPATIRVISEPQGANVLNPLDPTNEVLGVTPLELKRGKGQHRFRLVLAGYLPTIIACSVPAKGNQCRASLSPAPAPIIKSLDAVPAALKKGESTRLSWEVDVASDGVRCSLSEGIGSVPIRGQSQDLFPKKDTTYTLRCEGNGQSAVRSVLVPVEQPAAAVAILSFRAQDAQIQAGESTTVSWTVNNASSCSVNDVSVDPQSGSMDVRPEKRTLYTLRCTGSGPSQQSLQNQQSRSVAIDVQVKPPRIVSFAATRRKIKSGESSTLSWTTSDVISCTLNGESVSPADSKRVRLDETTTYSLSCEGSGQIQAPPRSIEIEVTPGGDPPPSQVRSCCTQAGMCPLLVPLPPGASCICRNPIMWATGLACPP